MIQTREELMTMPITLLRNRHIESPEEERLVQEVLNERQQDAPPEREIYRGDVIMANIDTPEKEAEWQAIIDKRTEEAKPKAVVLGEPSTNEQVVAEEPKQIEQLKEPENPEAKVKFCEFCDSRGVRHKLNCTREK